jgi:hypothetical protein
VGHCQDILAGGMDGWSLPVVHLIWGHQADTGVVMMLIIPQEEGSAEPLCILDAAEAFGELRLVFQGLEMRLRGKRPVIPALL